MITLKNVLSINAISSGITGLGLIAFHESAASLIGTTGSSAIIGVGVFLFLFALMVFIESRREITQASKVKTIITLDVIWVVASFFVVVLQLVRLSTIGYLLISGVAVWVAVMAVLQIGGLKQITTANA